jgi:hypothetical protein
LLLGLPRRTSNHTRSNGCCRLDAKAGRWSVVEARDRERRRLHRARIEQTRILLLGLTKISTLMISLSTRESDSTGPIWGLGCGSRRVSRRQLRGIANVVRDRAAHRLRQLVQPLLVALSLLAEIHVSA